MTVSRNMPACVIAVQLILVGGCGAKTAAPDHRRDGTVANPNGQFFEGWSCSPEAGGPVQNCSDDSVREYFYMSFSARGSRAMNEPAAEAACRRAARRQLTGDGLAKIMAVYVERTSGLVDGESAAHAILNRRRGSLHETGFYETGVYDCCPLNQRTGRCANRASGEAATWEECLCAGYLKFPGGQRAFEAQAKAVADEAER